MSHLDREGPGGARYERWFGGVAALLLLGAWELAAVRGWLSPAFFPPPSTIAATLSSLTASGELTTHLGATLSRVVLGFTVGASAGLVLGLLLGASTPLRRALDPCIAALHPVPKIALFPLFMILLGIGEAPKLVVVAITTFFPMVITVMGGVREIHPVHFEVAQNYGAGGFQSFRHVILPGSLPAILTGARLSLNLALTISVALELISADRGLGALIWFAWETLRTEWLFASVLVVALLGICFNVVLETASRVLVPWRADR